MKFCMTPGHIIVGSSYGHNVSEVHRWRHLALFTVGVLPVMFVRRREKHFWEHIF